MQRSLWIQATHITRKQKSCRILSGGQKYLLSLHLSRCLSVFVWICIYRSCICACTIKLTYQHPKLAASFVRRHLRFSWSSTVAGLPRLSRLSAVFIGNCKSERHDGFWKSNLTNFFLWKPRAKVTSGQITKILLIRRLAMAINTVSRRRIMSQWWWRVTVRVSCWWTISSSE